MRTSINTIAISMLFVVVSCSLSFSQEQLTITTYYPSPFGSYRDLGVTDSLQVGPFPMANAQGRVHTGGTNAEFSFARRDLAAAPGAVAGARYVWYNQAGTAALWTPVAGDVFTIDTSGNLAATNMVYMKHKCLMLSYGGNSYVTQCPAGTSYSAAESPAWDSNGGIFYCCTP